MRLSLENSPYPTRLGESGFRVVEAVRVYECAPSSLRAGCFMRFLGRISSRHATDLAARGSCNRYHCRARSTSNNTLGNACVARESDPPGPADETPAQNGTRSRRAPRQARPWLETTQATRSLRHWAP